ncbi:hypothetical protein KCW14_12860, partial [Staphylococcus aureus]|nr:hypothetical protein [Staphylococcus aureus]
CSPYSFVFLVSTIGGAYHCALLIEAGVHIKEIQERLRHKDINTTMNIYAKITNSYKKDASQKFSKLMENVSKDLF